MIFSSLTFLFVFLPVTLLGYRLLPKRLRIGFLLLASLIFYAWGEPLYVFLMAGSILVNWLLGFQVAKDGPRKKAFLALSIVLNLLLLLIFKYTGLLWDTVKGLFPVPLSEKTVAIRLPIGISFFTFQIMSYVIDVYRGKAKAQKNPILFGAYVSMFPQLIAGPIVRYVDIEAQLDQPDLSLEGFSQGVGLFVVGLGKKVLLANGVAVLWRELSAAPAQSGVLAAWVGLFAYTFQIYFDFSGYSDMACGLGRMLGFRFVQNFRYPYVADSVTDFWRRWHISLSTWFREYVYIPLGGNRRGLPRQVLNLLIVWTLTGLWHGASWNFLLWGLYYGVLLILEKLFLGKILQKLPKFLRQLLTFLMAALGWGVFYFTDFSALGTFFAALVGAGSSKLISAEAGAWVLGYLPLLIVCALAATPLGATVNKRLEKVKVWPWVRLALGAALFLLCLGALASQSYNPFIYFRF
ncbi:MAG: MBOAT family protein [Clostridia bacterium]|nr:MBOAT family protein [Clostridia bacterium]